jgi:hypothetical protein
VFSYQNSWIAGLVSADLPKRVDPGTWTLAGHFGQAGDHQQRISSLRVVPQLDPYEPFMTADSVEQFARFGELEKLLAFPQVLLELVLVDLQ